MKHILYGLIAALFLTGCSSKNSIPAVTDFNLDNYLGTWYEVARFPHSFENGMSNVSATYALNDKGGVSVVNRGFKDAAGTWKEADGTAYFIDDKTTAHLKVTFFWPFYGGYKVIALDDEYQWAVVCSDSFNYLWFLTRSPQITPERKASLIKRSEAFGFDVTKLIWVDQSKNLK